MTLLLSNEDIESVLDMRRCLAVLEHVYADLAEEATTIGLRCDVAAPSPQPGGVYDLKVYCAAYPRKEVAAIRLNSDLYTWRQHNGGTQRHKIPAAPGNRWVGLILLFSTRSGEPLALFPDGVIQRARVGATSAVGMRRLARPDAAELTIIGSGWQAGSQAMAACAVRDFRRVRVFSPNRVHREEFCATWERALGVPFEPIESSSAAVRGSDVVLCATNSMHPVLRADDIEPGAHLGFIRTPEVGDDALARADVLIRHIAVEQMATYQVIPAADSPELRSDRGWDASVPDRLAGLPELVELTSGRIPGRTARDQITCFGNVGGMALQFAAVGHAVWEMAREAGVGRELPTEWFTQTVHP